LKKGVFYRLQLLSFHNARHLAWPRSGDARRFGFTCRINKPLVLSIAQRGMKMKYAVNNMRFKNLTLLFSILLTGFSSRVSHVCHNSAL
jgi:hypothetical protein